MRMIFGFGFCCFGMIVLAGCATTKGPSPTALEGRMQSLENRVQVLESGMASSESGVSSDSVIEGRAARSSTAETMTKKDIQKALKNAGYYDGMIDGKIGPKTKAALMDFQKNMGLKVDGVAGRNTREELLKYLP